MIFIMIICPAGEAQIPSTEEKVNTNRFHNGFAPITGPIDPLHYEEVLMEIKKNSPEKSILIKLEGEYIK